MEGFSDLPLPLQILSIIVEALPLACVSTLMIWPSEKLYINVPAWIAFVTIHAAATYILNWKDL